MRWIVALFLLAAPMAWAQPADDAVHAALNDYARYHRDVSLMTDAPIASQDMLDAMLARAAGYDPAAVSRGWMAYGALTAAQSPAFVAGVRGRVRAAGRAPVLRQLTRDPTYARRRPAGASEAIGLILGAARGDAARLALAGERYNEVARTIEVAGWSALPEDVRSARDARLRSGVRSELAPLARVGVLSATPLSDARAFGGASYWDALAQRETRAAPRAPATANSTRQATIDRMLTLAGLIIVGETPRSALLDDAPTRECLELELLQYRQCVSVSHSGDDDAFCLARHGLARPGACFAAIAR